MSFLQRFFSKKEDETNNSLQQEIILESMQEMQESMAEHVSEATSSTDNIKELLENPQPSQPSIHSVDTEEEEWLQQSIDDNSEDTLLQAVKHAQSPDEIASIIDHYQSCLESWNQKAILLKKNKHLKEYLSITAALTMLVKLSQTTQILQGKQLHEAIQKNLSTQRQAIENQARMMQSQNNNLHNRQQQFNTQQQQMEQSLKATLAKQKNVTQSINPEQLQAILKQTQALKESSRNNQSGLLAQLNKNLQTILNQQQNMIRANSDNQAKDNTARLHNMQSQQQIQQTLRQSTQLQQLMRMQQQQHSTIITQLQQTSSAAIDSLVNSKISTINANPLNKGLLNNQFVETLANSNIAPEQMQQEAHQPKQDTLSATTEATTNHSHSKEHSGDCPCGKCSKPSPIEAANQAAVKALADIQKQNAIHNVTTSLSEMSGQSTHQKHPGHSPTCTGPCCNPQKTSIEAITKLAIQASSEVQSKVAHGKGCPCCSGVKKASVEQVFQQQQKLAM